MPILDCPLAFRVTANQSSDVVRLNLIRVFQIDPNAQGDRADGRSGNSPRSAMGNRTDNSFRPQWLSPFPFQHRGWAFKPECFTARFAAARPNVNSVLLFTEARGLRINASSRGST